MTFKAKTSAESVHSKTKENDKLFDLMAQKNNAFKIYPVIVLTAASFKHPTTAVNQYVDNDSNQAVMGMTFWTKKKSLF